MLAVTADINTRSESRIPSSGKSLDELLANNCDSVELRHRNLAQAITTNAGGNVNTSKTTQVSLCNTEQNSEPGRAFKQELNFASLNPPAAFSNFPTYASILSESKNDRFFGGDLSAWNLEQHVRNININTPTFDNNSADAREDLKYSYLTKKSHPNTVGLPVFSNRTNFNISTPQYDIQSLSSCFSSISTRFISIGLLPQDIDPSEMEFLKNTGKIWRIYSDRVHDLGLLVVAYYDLRDAILTVKQLRSTRIRGENVTVNYIRISQLAKSPTIFNSFKNINDFEGKLLLSYCSPNQFSSNMQLILESCGDIREISQLPYRSDIVVEYYDVRHAVAAEEKLHRMDPQGTQYQVNFHPDEDNIDKIVIFHDYQDISNNFATQGYSKYNQNESISGIWKEEYLKNNKAQGNFIPGSLYTTSDSQPIYQGGHPPTSLTNRTNLLVEPYLSTQILPGLQFDSRSSNIFPKTRENYMTYLPTSYAPSNMPRFSSNSGSCENIVPSRNQVDVWKIIQGFDNRTTFMIRNIPNKYTQKMLLECIDETHKGEYDFVYLRMDFKNHCNVGYAFINFIDVSAVISFIEKRVGHKWGRFNSDKICHISYANIQGKNALIEKFRNSSVMEKDPTYRPKIFYSSGPFKGLEAPFPNTNAHATGTYQEATSQWMPHHSGGKWRDHESDTDSGICNSYDEKTDTSGNK